MRSRFVVELLLVPAALAMLPPFSGMELGPIDEGDDTDLLGTNGTNGWGTFDQLLDHKDPSLGTFKQRFWYGTESWKGPGSPIITVSPGEQAGDQFNVTYTTPKRLAGLFAKEVGGAIIILEHRYWGGSSPFEELTVENLRYLTLENAIHDMTYFARNFDPPFDPSGKSAPDRAPWILSGGSYAGALAGWTAALDPGTFWAYHGTSGVVEAVGNFWQYFVPVQEATPQNCTRDQMRVIDHVDDVLMNGSPDQKLKLKAKFLLEELEDGDFVSAMASGPSEWQSTQFSSVQRRGNNSYHQFCDFVENMFPNSTNTVPGPEGVGLDKALEGYAKWFREVMLPGTCEDEFGYDDFKGTYNAGCYATSNASNPVFKDLSVNNTGNRQWSWLLCNEPFEYWQTGAPRDRPSIVSRLVDVDYFRKQCALFFPPDQGGCGAYGLAQGKDADDVNARTGGWRTANNSNTKRLMFVNGQLDTWRDATVSSEFRPGGPLQSTPDLPVHVIPNGTHCSDAYGQNWPLNPGLQAVVDKEVAQIKAWVDEFYHQRSDA